MRIPNGMMPHAFHLGVAMLFDALRALELLVLVFAAAFAVVAPCLPCHIIDDTFGVSILNSTAVVMVTLQPVLAFASLWEGVEVANSVLRLQTPSVMLSVLWMRSCGIVRAMIVIVTMRVVALHIRPPMGDSHMHDLDNARAVVILQPTWRCRFCTNARKDEAENSERVRGILIREPTRCFLFGDVVYVLVNVELAIF